MAHKNKSDLGYLGEDFQYRLIHEFMADHAFFEDLTPIVDQNMFTAPQLKVFVGIMKNYYDRNGSVPSYDLMEIELRNLSHNDIETESYLAVLDKIRNTDIDGMDTIKDLAVKFFRQQNIIKTANEILRTAGNGDTSKYEECVTLLNEAMQKGTHNDFGETVFDHLDETLSDEYRDPIPTGIDKIDETLEGGLGKGELGVIIGPSGFGKSQPLDSVIITPFGCKEMGEIELGDEVIGGDGKPHTVVGVYPQGVRPIYLVKFSNGTECECDIDHLWKVRTLGDENFYTLKLRDVIKRGVIKDNKPQFMIPTCECVEFFNTETEYDPYSIGGAIDNESTENTCLTDDYVVNSKEKRLALLQGIMDRYGSVNEDGSCHFTSKDRKIVDSVIFVVRSLGGYTNFTQDTELETFTVDFFLFDSTMKVFREKTEYQDCVDYPNKNNFTVFITYAEKSRDTEAQCIMVDSEEHLYLTNDFIVTHNTSLTTAMASHAALCGRKVLQIVFEDRIKQIQRKHIGKIVGIESKDLSKPSNIDKVRETLKHFEGSELLKENLRIVRFPSGEKTATQIEAFIKRLINKGFRPELVIIDYFECLAHENRSDVSNDYEKEGKTMRKFEAMARRPRHSNMDSISRHKGLHQPRTCHHGQDWWLC